jgi:phage baseplate assembly protein W
MTRHDIAYPFRIAAGAGQAAQAAYGEHVDQMIRQVLLTDPGERACLPEFGAGLRRLLFAPLSSALESTTKMVVSQSLKRWLGDQIVVREVTVSTADNPAPGEQALPEGAILIRVDYELIETRGARQTAVQVR